MATETRQELIPPGSRVGKYEIVRRLAYGGMAEIYLARVSGIQGFEKHVVLKSILPQFAAREDFLQMFLQEARLAATLDQANIAHVYDIGEIGGSYFYTMEYLHGEDLRRIVRHLRRAARRLPLAHALGIAAGVACGLHYAHEKRGPEGRPLGIVHRDVSPSNIVVTFDGDVKLVDFGIAKMTTDPDLTQGRRLKGKISYMSPEQLHGRPIDRRSDVFSLGVVLFEITTNRRLFTGENEVDVMRAAMECQVPTPTSIDPAYPRDLEQVVMRALDRDPARRHPTARDLQRDLEAVALTQRAQISSATLADWMLQTFGPRPEPWLSGSSGAFTAASRGDSAPANRASSTSAQPTLPPPPPPRPAAPGEVATKVVVREDVIVPTDQALPIVEATGIALGEVPAVPAPPPRPRARPPRFRVLIGGLVMGAIIAATAVGLAHFRRGRAAQASLGGGGGGGAPVLVLVAEGGHVAVDRAAGAPVAAAASARAEEAPAAPSADVTKRRARRERSRVATAKSVTGEPRASARNGAQSATAFSAALARRGSELRACVAASPAVASDDSPIEFRFRIRADGHVESVSILPEALARTPLGACLVKVGAGTVFAPQPEPVAFRIPMSLRVRQAGTP